MRHKFLVLTVKELLKSVHIYGSYRKIKTGLSLFLDHPVDVMYTGWAKKSKADNFCNNFALCWLLPANFHNFWHMYTIGNLQPEDI